MNLLDSSIYVDRNQINSYLQLALLKQVVNKNEDAMNYINEGLEVISEIREQHIPFHKSLTSAIQSSSQQLDIMEQMLLEMRDSLG